MEHKLLYLFGAPGAGKSTLVRELVRDHMGIPYRQDGVDLIDYPSAGVEEMGKERASFRGTDALGMTVITAAVPFLIGGPPLLMAEGDRLAVARFWNAATHAGYKLELVYLDTPPATAAARREERGGKPMNQTWVLGRTTKSERLAEEWDVQRLDGTLPTSALVKQLKEVSEVAACFG